MSADQVELGSLTKMRDVLGGTISHPKRKTAAGNSIYRWGITSATEIRSVLPLLIPHLTIKRRKAELILRYANTMRARKSSKPLTSEELGLRAQIEREFGGLKNGV